MVEHLTADQEVPGSNPGAPFGLGIFGSFKVRLLMLSKESM